MLKKFFRFLILGIAGILLVSGVCYAIGDPNYVSIGDAYVFRNVLETGDQLYFVRYDVSYGSIPEEDSEDTWQMALYDSDDNLVATRPLNYYQHNIISIYLTSSQAIAWEAEHYVRIQGMPSIFSPLIEGTNMRTRSLSPGDYYEATSLGGIIITQAGILEADWEIDLLTSGDRLNSTGSTYFTAAIPRLSSMVPEIFQTTVRGLTIDYAVWERDYVEVLEGHEGSKLRFAVTDIGDFFGLSEGWSGFWLISIMYLLVVGTMYPSIGNSGWGLIAGFPVLAGAAYLGVGTQMLTMVVVLVLVAALIFGIYFILGRFV